ncbi:major capsid protein [Pectobacterium phage phiPccP-1]|uniref:Major capsid protein n=2 Tax=Unyawovirus TaxID=2732695 RepID=A0A2D2W5Y2_9CAUD|nr:head protein [Pectobacterium phage DU_PP_II]ATS93697.1 major capsid protein [Pectobacterium phage DU_PP_II]QPI17214.1 major capsid protein [Pectobacterium phage phiPccP-1]UUG66316.1 major capsid protein [Pectobacterium phage vB_PcaP_P15_PC2B6]
MPRNLGVTSMVASGIEQDVTEEVLTPQQKAARTRAANKAAKEAAESSN